MENLETIQFLMETVERLTKEGTTYKVELEHTKERVTALEEESAKKDAKIASMIADKGIIKTIVVPQGKLVNIVVK